MKHFNEHQPVVIGMMLTGVHPDSVMPLDLCLLPLDYSLNPEKTRMPFMSQIQPPEHLYPEYDLPQRQKDRNLSNIVTLSKDKFTQARMKGQPESLLADLFVRWVASFKLRRHKKLLPICYDWSLTRPALVNWLGEDLVEATFDWRVRDLLCYANLLNDLAGLHFENYPFPRVHFQALCWACGILNEKHTAVGNAKAIARIYTTMLRRDHRDPEFLKRLAEYQDNPLPVDMEKL